jgi:hypothetical protein
LLDPVFVLDLRWRNAADKAAAESQVRALLYCMPLRPSGWIDSRLRIGIPSFFYYGVGYFKFLKRRGNYLNRWPYAVKCCCYCLLRHKMPFKCPNYTGFKKKKKKLHDSIVKTPVLLWSIERVIATFLLSLTI